jgi:dTDP-4-dehydrorhamnose 3,5-epimerase
MHFQMPPHAHNKLVYCIQGCVLDVILDLRTESPTFGQSCGFELSAANRYVIHIPVGFAHGFLAIEDGSCLVYKTDVVHAPDSDAGIKWDSFGFEWSLNGAPPEISKRDSEHPSMPEFKSPF